VRPVTRERGIERTFCGQGGFCTDVFYERPLRNQITALEIDACLLGDGSLTLYALLKKHLTHLFT